MNDANFLKKLKKENKIELIEITENMSSSYNKKSKDCLLAAKILFKQKLFENSIGEAYYSMYNSLLSLFFICGIKCENHTGSVSLLKLIFKLEKLSILFLKAKEERIDKQYYTLTVQTTPATKISTKEFIVSAENFILEINTYKNNLKLEGIKSIRDEFGKLIY